jgi:hypothetical protein
MIEQEITLTLTCTEALELRDLIEWVNDPQFKPLAQSIDQKVYERYTSVDPRTSSRNRPAT